MSPRGSCGRPAGMRRRFSRLRNLARERWDAVLAAPGGEGHVARGAAAGAFAAMIPAFGVHLALALGAALLARGSLAAAAATRSSMPSSCRSPTSSDDG